MARVLQKFTSLLERASIDEAYLDITAPVSTLYIFSQLQKLMTFCYFPNCLITGDNRNKSS